jgi:DtxR family Mn-dependent transcriptional regulator
MTTSEENYLKTIYHLATSDGLTATTNAIAERLETKASSVTDMLKKLSDKGLIIYKKYQAVQLTNEGLHLAKMVVRKHRLWEVFLVEKLNFSWDSVHDIAEQLEHIQSPELIVRLDDFLGNPTQDPHGDPIPDAEGRLKKVDKQLLGDILPGDSCICVGVKDSSTSFLQYLNRVGISLGTKIEVLNREPFDLSVQIKIMETTYSVSAKMAANLYVKKF